MKTKTTTSTTFSAKLGTHRHGERSRIWLEGKRLIAAGFKPGMTSFVQWTPAQLTIHNSETVGSFDEQRTISGKGDRAIIDITGSKVFDTFGKHGATVSVTFGDGVITIRRGK